MTGCTICMHRSSSAINAALLAGDSATKIAGRYGVSRYAVGRHGRAHLATGELVVAERSGERRLDDLDLRLQQLEAVLTGVIDEALRSGKVTTLIAAVRECRQTVESIGKVRGQLDERPQINILALPQFTEASQRLLRALAPWPEARVAAAAALTDQHAAEYEPDQQPDEGRDHGGRARVEIFPAVVAPVLVPALSTHEAEGRR